MPELPEVETVVRGLRDDVVGRRFTSAEVTWLRQIEPFSAEDFSARLSGQRVENLRRRAKYIVFELSEDFLLVHLKMTGRLYVAEKDDPRFADDRWVRTVIGLDDGRDLRFSDLRKFGRMQLVADELEITGRLGPEPLEDDFTLDVLKERLKGRTRTIKPLLLDQTFVAGVGNIYADEALWISKVDPRRKADTLKSKEITLLHGAIREVLFKGIEREGASVNWYRKPDGETGSQQNYFKVYGQEGEPCARCGSPISKIKLAQRGTHFCANCQK